VAVKRPRQRTGVLAGAGLGAVAGALAGCTGTDRSECIDAPIMAGALGAIVGLGVGTLLPRTVLAYPLAYGGGGMADALGQVTPLVRRDALGLWFGVAW
jgi:hypothetical protein